MNEPRERSETRERRKASLILRLWDVHTWLGVMASVVLSVMFVAGAFALFHDELSTWEDPRVLDVRSGLSRDLDAALARGVATTSDPISSITLRLTPAVGRRDRVRVRGPEGLAPRALARCAVGRARLPPRSILIADVTRRAPRAQWVCGR